MPSLNSHGEWAAGIGNGIAAWGTVSGTGTVVWTPAGGTDWLTNDVLIAQHCPGAGGSGCVLKTKNVRTGVETTVSTRGANQLYAGGGVWAAWLAGYGVFSSTGLLLGSSGLEHVGPDGAIAIKRVYQAYGPYDVHETSGLVWLLTAGAASYIRLLGGYRAVWTEGGNPHTAGACPTPNPMTRPFFWLTMIPPPTPTDPDGWWCLYSTAADSLLLHPVTSTSGYVVAPPGSMTFYPDLVRLSPTTIRVTYSTTQGENPSDVRVITIDLTSTRTVLGSAVPPTWEEPTDPPTPPSSSGSGTPAVPPETGPRVVATPVPTIPRVYPHVDGITDWRVQQTTRLLWDRTFDLEARLQALATTQGDLVSATNEHNTQVGQLRQVSGEALALAQRGAGGAGGGEGGGGVGTMPNYGAIVNHVLNDFFVSPIVPLADAEAGKAQLTRVAAWEIYQVDPRIRLLAKTSGTQINGRSVDKIVQGTDGSFADIATNTEPDDPSTIKAQWGPHGPDKNTTKDENWIVPTATIAAEPGPMTRV